MDSVATKVPEIKKKKNCSPAVMKKNNPRPQEKSGPSPKSTRKKFKRLNNKLVIIGISEDVSLDLLRQELLAKDINLDTIERMKSKRKPAGECSENYIAAGILHTSRRL